MTVRLAKAASGVTLADVAAVNELTNVDVQALSIVTKGANRKRYFLRRSGDEPLTEPLIVSPARHGLVVKADAAGEWEAVYCVVAEPNWLEDAGMYGDQAVADRWASEDEIRKAAHRFMRNGGLVNKMHESLEPFGALVENAVALADFTVTGPDGTEHTIRKGSWYVAVEPSADGKAAIEAGEFTGVSIEGTGDRIPVAKFDPDQPRADDGKWVRVQMRSLLGQQIGDLLAPFRLTDDERERLHRNQQRITAGQPPMRPPRVVKAVDRSKAGGPLRHLIAYYMKKPHPFRACVKDNRKRFGSRVDAICAGLKDVALGTTKWRNQGGKVGKVRGRGDLLVDTVARCATSWYGRGLSDDDAVLALDALAQMHDGDTVDSVAKANPGILAKIGRAVGLSDDDLAELERDELAKSRPTFAERMAQRDFEDELPDAFNVLRDAVWSAFYPDPNDDDPDTPRALIEQSLDEFKAWATDLMDASSIAKIAESIEKAGGQTPDSGNVEDVLTDEEKAELAKIGDVAEKLEALPEAIAKAIREGAEDDDTENEDGEKPATLDSVAESVGQIAKRLEDVEGKVTSLGSGAPAPENGNGPVAKSGDKPWQGVL